MRLGSSRRPGVAGLASTLRSVRLRWSDRDLVAVQCSAVDSLDRGQRVRFGFLGELRGRMSFARSGVSDARGGVRGRPSCPP